MRFNMRIGPVRTKMSNTQKMNNYEIIPQKISDSHICSLDKSEAKSINGDKSKSHVCSTDESESKSVHISVNTIEVEDANNKTKYE